MLIPKNGRAEGKGIALLVISTLSIPQDSSPMSWSVSVVPKFNTKSATGVGERDAAENVRVDCIAEERSAEQAAQMTRIDCLVRLYIGNLISALNVFDCFSVSLLSIAFGNDSSAAQSINATWPPVYSFLWGAGDGLLKTVKWDASRSIATSAR